MHSNSRMKNKHILMLGISTVIIKIFYHFLFLRGRGEPCILHHIIHHSTRNRNIYGLGEWISTVFKIFMPWRNQNYRTIPLGHDLHNISYWLTQLYKEQKIYRIRDEECNGLQDIWQFSNPGYYISCNISF